MAWEFEITPETAQHVYRELEQRGLIFSKRAIGHFVIENEDQIHSIRNASIETVVENFFSEMHNLGLTSKEIKKRLKEKR